MRRWHGYSKNIRIRWKCIIIIVLSFVLIITLCSHIRPIFKSITTNQSRIKSIDTINRVITEQLSKNALSYNDVIDVERDSAGKVLAITTNMVVMNELKATIITSIQKKFVDNGYIDTGIPLGTLLGNNLFHGRGPNVPLRLTLSGNINADFKSSFISSGINQTKHQIYLNIHASVYSFILGFDTTTEVETNVPIAETIIVGEVPQVFANIK